jgi:hypothetical protein
LCENDGHAFTNTVTSIAAMNTSTATASAPSPCSARWSVLAVAQPRARWMLRDGIAAQ